jgi:RNA polymerase sigma-70 factor (ECF subfamily)
VQDDENLIKRAKQKDVEALTCLYEAHFDRIYRYIVLRVASRSEAEDLTQQVFLKAIQSISSYNWKGLPFSAWLFRIARNQVIDYIRKRSRSLHFNEQLLPEGPREAGIEEKAEEAFIVEKVKEAMKSLTALQQEVISLRFAGGLSIQETAKAMSKSEGAVKALQHSALDNLRKILGVTIND